MSSKKEGENKFGALKKNTIKEKKQMKEQNNNPKENQPSNKVGVDEARS